MDGPLKTGLSFGLTSGVITTLGLMVGLNATTGQRMVVIGGILTIAVADAFSDALGIHLSEESRKEKEFGIWEGTISTFLSKFVFAMTFLVPVMLFDSLHTAIVVSVVWGGLLLSALSYLIAKNEGKNPLNVIAEHLFIAALVIVMTSYIGSLINSLFV